MMGRATERNGPETVAFRLAQGVARPMVRGMSAKLILHYAPDNASLCVRLALEECDMAYDTVLVDRRAKQQRSPEYLALNPHGLIPVLVTEDGPMFETAAILLWISEQPKGAQLMPQGPERQAALSWLFWLSNTLHPALRILFYGKKHIAPEGRDMLRDATRGRVTEMLDRLEALASAEPAWLMGPSALTCYLCPMLRWLSLYPADDADWFDLGRWPSLFALAKEIEARPATLRAAGYEGLGASVFTRPSPPNPPEGSAI